MVLNVDDEEVLRGGEHVSGGRVVLSIIYIIFTFKLKNWRKIKTEIRILC